MRGEGEGLSLRGEGEGLSLRGEGVGLSLRAEGDGLLSCFPLPNNKFRSSYYTNVSW